MLVIFLYDLFFADARINITVEYFYSLQVLKENYLTLFKFPKKKLVATSIGQILIYTNFYVKGKKFKKPILLVILNVFIFHRY